MNIELFNLNKATISRCSRCRELVHRGQKHLIFGNWHHFECIQIDWCDTVKEMSFWVLERYISIYLHVLDIYQTYPCCRGPAPWINTRREKKSFCQVPSRAAKVNCYKDNEGKPFCSLSAPVSLILNNSWSLVIVIDQEMICQSKLYGWYGQSDICYMISLSNQCWIYLDMKVTFKLFP